MLPTRDLPQNKRPTHTESEGLGKNIPSKWRGIKSQGTNTYFRQNRLPKISPKKRHRRTLHNTQRKTPSRRYKYYKHICTQYRVPKYIRKILEDFMKDIYSNTIIVGVLNTTQSKMDRYSKQTINKDIVEWKNTQIKCNKGYIQNFTCPRSQVHFLFKCTWNIFKDRPHDRT